MTAESRVRKALRVMIIVSALFLLLFKYTNYIAIDSQGSPLDHRGAPEGAGGGGGRGNDSMETGAGISRATPSHDAEGWRSSANLPSDDAEARLSPSAPADDAEDVLSEEQYLGVERRFKERHRTLQEVCSKYRNWTHSLFQTLNKQLYVSERYDLFACLVPKVASSTWMSHLLRMRGVVTDSKNLHTHKFTDQINAMEVLGMTGTRSRLQEATKVLTVRHPLERLVSAFRDKFANGQRIDSPQSSAHYRFFWKPALRALQKPTDILQLSFEEFLRFVLRNRREGHWETVNRLCSPCSVSYDYVVRLETFAEDLLYLSKKMAIRELDLRVRRNKKTSSEVNVTGVEYQQAVNERGSNVHNSTIQYYLQVPAPLLAKVLQFYKKDLEMFSYQVPPELSQVLHN